MLNAERVAFHFIILKSLFDIQHFSALIIQKAIP